MPTTAKTIKATFSCGFPGCTKKHSNQSTADNCRKALEKDAAYRAGRSATWTPSNAAWLAGREGGY